MAAQWKTNIKAKFSQWQQTSWSDGTWSQNAVKSLVFRLAMIGLFRGQPPSCSKDDSTATFCSAVDERHDFGSPLLQRGVLAGLQ